MLLREVAKGGVKTLGANVLTDPAHSLLDDPDRNLCMRERVPHSRGRANDQPYCNQSMSANLRITEVKTQHVTVANSVLGKYKDSAKTY